MLLMVQSYPAGSAALLRHWDYFLKSGASEVWVIATEDGECTTPDGVITFKVGRDSYINGHVLPERLINTLEVGLASSHDRIMVCEYDCLFFHPIRYHAMEHAVASHLAGGPTWGSKAQAFFHNPWLFHREFAERFVDEGRKAIREGVCYRNRGEASSPESSPDVFFGLVCERLGQTVQTNLWTEYSRNDLSLDSHIKEARDAYRNRVDVIHGIKSARELNFILS